MHVERIVNIWHPSPRCIGLTPKRSLRPCRDDQGSRRGRAGDREAPIPQPPRRRHRHHAPSPPPGAGPSLQRIGRSRLCNLRR
jgi:hypothetical protein